MSDVCKRVQSVTCKSVLGPTKVSSKSACLRMSTKSVLQECQVRASYKSVNSE